MVSDTVEPIYVSHVWFYSKPLNLIQVANLRKSLDTMKIELSTITRANVLFRAQRQVVELESSYVNLSMSTVF